MPRRSMPNTSNGQNNRTREYFPEVHVERKDYLNDQLLSQFVYSVCRLSINLAIDELITKIYTSKR